MIINVLPMASKRDNMPKFGFGDSCGKKATTMTWYWKQMLC